MSFNDDDDVDDTNNNRIFSHRLGFVSHLMFAVTTRTKRMIIGAGHLWDACMGHVLDNVRDNIYGRIDGKQIMDIKNEIARTKKRNKRCYFYD